MMSRKTDQDWLIKAVTKLKTQVEEDYDYDAYGGPDVTILGEVHRDISVLKKRCAALSDENAKLRGDLNLVLETAGLKIVDVPATPETRELRCIEDDQAHDNTRHTGKERGSDRSSKVGW